VTGAAAPPRLPWSLAACPDLDRWVRVEADGTIVLCTGKVEIGQGLRSAIARIGAEELDVALGRIVVQTGRTGGGPAEFMTAGSLSMMHSGASMRLAAAAARAFMMDLAAERLGCAVERLVVDDGVVRAPDGGATDYWSLMAGRAFGVAVDGTAAPKPAAAHTIVGRRAPRGEQEAIVTGTLRYVSDLAGPGTLFGRVVRPPGPRFTLVSLDDARVRAVPGVVDVVRSGAFLGVVARAEEQAVAAAAALAAAARWAPPEAALPADGPVAAALIGHEAASWEIADGAAVEGEAIRPPVVPEDAVATLRATFTRPHVLHGSIGPSSALARWTGGKLSFFSHSQMIHVLRDVIADLMDMDAADVEAEHVPGPGCYGHNGADDVVLDAALLARAVQGEVLVTWSREDEHAWEPYGPAMAVTAQASLGADGRIKAFNMDAWSHAHAGRPFPGAPNQVLAGWYLEEPRPWFPAGPPVDRHLPFHQNLDPYYDVGERRTVLHAVKTPLRVSALRAVGNFTHVFAIESLMDELAAAAGADPLAFRLAHLTDPRARAVLEAAAERAGPAPGSGGRGFAFGRYSNEKAYVAVVVDVAVDDATAQTKVDNLVVAGDAGEVVDPDALADQLEGGAVQALSWALMERVRWDDRGITTTDWDSYPIMRFPQAPARSEVVLLDRPGAPFLGAGEASLGPAAAALANAIADATGVRLRDMPFTPRALREAALDAG
jgi:nicotinate dehydrogenase subunit B